LRLLCAFFAPSLRLLCAFYVTKNSIGTRQ